MHGAAATQVPHHLVPRVMDAALERLSAAGRCRQAGRQGRLLAGARRSIGQLRASLDLEQGGALAHNLDDLYDYMERQLVRATAESRAAPLDEVYSLLSEIRSAWQAVPLALRPSVAR